MKTTKDVIMEYFSAFNKNKGWDGIVTSEVSITSPTGTIKGKEGFVEMTNQFRQLVTSAKVRSIISDEEQASALTMYELELPTGDKLALNVAEIIRVKGQKIDSFEIYFDTAQFNEFMSKMNSN